MNQSTNRPTVAGALGGTMLQSTNTPAVAGALGGTMLQSTNTPAVAGTLGGTMFQSTNRPAAGIRLSSSLRLHFKIVDHFSSPVTMTSPVTMIIVDGDGQLMYVVRSTGVPKETELVDANNCFIAAFRQMAGSYPIQWAAMSSGGANTVGEKLLTITKPRAFGKQLDVMTMNGLQNHLPFLKPTMGAGVAYKMEGSYSGRSIVVTKADTPTVIAQMNQGADADSFVVDVNPEANIVFVVSLFAIANAMKRVSTFRGAPLSFCLTLGGEFLAGIAYAFGVCVGDACVGGCAEGCAGGCMCC